MSVESRGAVTAGLSRVRARVREKFPGLTESLG
jgi:hypothetical protein